MKKALVTLAVGPNYRERWERLCRKTWIAYCERHRYDLILLDTALDTSERARCRSPAWQKCLNLEPSVAADYDRVVWVDSDILINPVAPCIAQSAPVEKI